MRQGGTIITLHSKKRLWGSISLTRSNEKHTTASQTPPPNHLHKITEGREEKVIGLIGNVVFMEKGTSPGLKSRLQEGILSEVVEWKFLILLDEHLALYLSNDYLLRFAELFL